MSWLKNLFKQPKSVDKTDNISVLVVESSMIVRKTIESVFEGNGYSVTSVAYAADAKKTLKDSSPNVALIDTGLPNDDCLELCGLINKNMPGAHLYLLVPSFEEFREETAVRAGALGIFGKPFENVKDLVDAVDAAGSWRTASPD